MNVRYFYAKRHTGVTQASRGLHAGDTQASRRRHAGVTQVPRRCHAGVGCFQIGLIAGHLEEESYALTVPGARQWKIRRVTPLVL